MKTTIVLILVLFSNSVSNAQSNSIQWANSVVQNPDQYFKNTYETSIFKKLYSKYPNLSIEKVIQSEKQYIITLKLDNRPYNLVFEVDDNNRIRYAYRDPSSINIKNISQINNNFLIWIGKFFYRLDAADSSAINDMIFYDDIKIRYNQITNSSVIAEELIKDFRKISEPSTIEILEHKNKKYAFNAIFNLIGDLSIEVPDKFVHVPDTDYLQEEFFQEIIGAIKRDFRHKTNEKINKELIIKLFNKRYRDIRVENNQIDIPYQSRRFKKLKHLIYEVIGSYNNNFVIPKITLKEDKINNTIFVNDAFSIPLYTNQNRNHILIKIRKTIEFSYKMILAGSLWPDIFPSNIDGIFRYRGFKLQEIPLKTNKQWLALWTVLLEKGSLYCYPSKIEIIDNKIKQKSIIYLEQDNEPFYYHFGEIYLDFENNSNDPIPSKIEFIFYPFIKDEANMFSEELN